MSSFDKFEPTDAWFSRLKSFVLRDGSPSTFIKQYNKIHTEEDQTFKLKKSFVNILEERKGKQQNMDHQIQENKENKENNTLETLKDQIKQKSHINESILSTLNSNRISTSFLNQNHNESTLIEETSLWRQTTDDSFEFLEQIYDLTISDPNSTPQNKDLSKSGLNMKKRSSSNMTKICLADQTQLNDIEAPSTMWENSLHEDNSTYQTSPVKMVGLLRPSTIFEESAGDVSEDNTNNSDSISFKTAPNKIDETSSSEQFQSANESLKSETTKWKTLNYNSNSDESVDSLENAAANMPKLSINSDKSSTHIKRRFYDEGLKIGLLSPQQNSQSITSQSTDSLDLDLREEALSKSTTSLLVDSLNLQQIEKGISDDSLELNTRSFESEKSLIDLNKSIHSVKSEVKEEKSSDFKHSMNTSNDDEGECDLNQGFSIQEDNESKDEQDSLDSTLNNTPREFNDTIEEMEYIMQKGMKYMTATGTTPKLMKGTMLSSDSAKTPKQQQQTPSPSYHHRMTPITPKTVIAAKNLPKKALPLIESTNNVKESQFKMPTTSRIPQAKQTTSMKKQAGFQHIVSPVGAYIKNTPVFPIVASSKSRCNTIGTKTARGLEFETNTYNSPSKVNYKPTTCSLPKKAYVASEFKHYTDERTPIKIPGGEKIHRYLESAKLPTVIKHDGRLKLNDLFPPRDSEGSSRETVNRTVDSSLADLSMMSGDISLLTIKDAQKFGYK